MYDLLIQNGTIIDGTKKRRYQADVAIQGDKIAKIGTIEPDNARKTIDAQGKIVAPGFIDVHTHADGWLLKEPNLFSKTSQGFTTEVIMADGISYAPLNRHTAQEWMYYMRTLNGLQFVDYEGWESLADYMALIDGRTAQNAITHIPYANVRTLACGFGPKTPDDVQMNHIINEIEKGMDEGAVGLSTGLDYIVEFWATTDELVEACRAMAPQQGIYVTHIRYKKGIVAGLKEAVEIGKRAGVPVHISHLKGAAQAQDRDGGVMAYINKVAINEVDFTFDVYPYMASSTMLNAIFPYEIWQDGPLRVFDHLRKPEIQTRAAHSISHVALDKTHIAWLPSKANSHHQGKSLAQYCAEIGQPPVQALTNLLIEENLAVLLVFRMNDDAEVEPFLQHSHYMMGSDGIYQPGGAVHPRQFGSATRLIGPFVRDRQLFSLEEAIYKMTSFPAERFGLKNRGVVAEGNFADLVIFDAETVTDKATLENPQQTSEGIQNVLVNGVVIVENDSPVANLPTRRPGRALRFKQ
ncbi:MAG: D-aminoacylase [Chloroflexota bacterium]